jgi:predicted N-acetyltransferase YhbS
MSIKIRLEEKADHFETENMTREAFWDLYKPGCDEHFVLHQLRQSSAFLPELDYVACDGEAIVGNIIYSKATISDETDRTTVLCMGPLSVAPAYQKRGIGSALLRKTVDIAHSMGYKAIVIFGDPGYYHRFGFRPARDYGIETADGHAPDAFMALELQENSLRGIRGRFYADEAFKVDEKGFEAYDRQFPYKEKHKREGQLE